MRSIAPIETERLIIRNWEDRDRAPYASFLAGNCEVAPTSQKP